MAEREIKRRIFYIATRRSDTGLLNVNYTFSTENVSENNETLLNNLANRIYEDFNSIVNNNESSDTTINISGTFIIRNNINGNTRYEIFILFYVSCFQTCVFSVIKSIGNDLYYELLTFLLHY